MNELESVNRATEIMLEYEREKKKMEALRNKSENEKCKLNEEGTPDHYDKKIQPVDYIVANGLGFLEGNVIKYVSRHSAKGHGEDISKAMHYCAMILKQYGYNTEIKIAYHRQIDRPITIIEKCDNSTKYDEED